MTGMVGKVKNPESIIVIGAGIGGMCVAARLAKAGHKVSIYEASNRTGGKCRTEWIGNYAFDTGPSLLTIPAVYRDFFQRTGDVMGRVLELESVSPSFDIDLAMELQLNSPTYRAKKHWQQSKNLWAPNQPLSGIKLCAEPNPCGMSRANPS